MKRLLLFLALSSLLASCSPAKTELDSLPDIDEAGDTFEMTEGTALAPTDVLFVDPQSVSAQREAFKEILRKSGRTSKGKRELYEAHIDELGANGVLQSIEELWPKCHSEAHALGATIHRNVQDIGMGLRVCADGCYSGCMHGVLMEAFTSLSDPDDPEAHVDLGKLADQMDDICYRTDAMTDSYSPGDCAHGVGHAVMSLAEYDVSKAIGYCTQFENPVMDYYCATGAYMEYVTEHDRQDALSKSVLYPCDENDFPAACTRYKMVHVIGRHYAAKGKPELLIQLCRQYAGKNRIACFHGLGNAHMSLVYQGKLALADLCKHGTVADNTACIEGAMERMAKYHEPRAKEVCAALPEAQKPVCTAAIENKMYSMTKDMSLYLSDDKAGAN